MKQLILSLLFLPIFLFGQKNIIILKGKDNIVGKDLINIRLERCTSVIVTNDAETWAKNTSLKLKNKSFTHYSWDGYNWIVDPIDSATLIHKTFEHGEFNDWSGYVGEPMLPQYLPVMNTIPALYIYSDCDTCVLKNKRGYVPIPKNKSMIRQMFDINYQPIYVGYTIWMVKHERGVQMDTELPFTLKEQG